MLTFRLASRRGEMTGMRRKLLVKFTEHGKTTLKLRDSNEISSRYEHLYIHVQGVIWFTETYKRDFFDYTEWRRKLWNDMTIDEIYTEAAAEKTR